MDLVLHIPYCTTTKATIKACSYRVKIILLINMYFFFWQFLVALWLTQPMAGLVTLLEQHIQREPTTTAIQATTEWEAVVALVNPLEDGLGVHLSVDVC